MVEHLKHERSVEDLCEDGGQLVSTGFQAGWLHTICAWCFPSFALFEDLTHVNFSYLQCRCGGEGGCWRCEWCFFKPAVLLIQVVCQLLILHSAGGGGGVSCNWWCLSYLSTAESLEDHFFLAFHNNSSLPLWSPFQVCIWPVYIRLCHPSWKHLLWPDGTVWVLQWSMVCHCCMLDESW